METTRDLLLSRWPQVKGHVGEKWGQLTEEDISRLSGKMEDLAVLLQEHYGYSKPQAVVEIFKWLQDQGQSHHNASF